MSVLKRRKIADLADLSHRRPPFRRVSRWGAHHPRVPRPALRTRLLCVALEMGCRQNSALLPPCAFCDSCSPQLVQFRVILSGRWSPTSGLPGASAALPARRRGGACGRRSYHGNHNPGISTPTGFDAMTHELV